MALNNISAFAIFADRGALDRAIASLTNAGFRNTDISVLFPENLGSKDFAHERHSKAPEGVAAGGGSGAIAGAAIGWLLGAGTIAIPGLDYMAVAGPIVGMLSAMGIGSILGGITGAIVGFAVPEYEAKRYAGRVRNGGILVSVHCDDVAWAKKARTLLRDAGASDISTASEAKAHFARSARPIARSRVHDTATSK